MVSDLSLNPKIRFKTSIKGFWTICSVWIDKSVNLPITVNVL